MIKSNLFTKNIISKLISSQFCNVPCNVTVSNILKTKKVGDKVKIQGWVKSLRKLKDTVFLDVSDGSCEKKLQVVISNSSKPENLSTESSVVASGTLGLSPKGNIELNAENFEVCGQCILADGYPFLPRKVYPPEYVRQYLHLRPRTKSFSSFLRIRDAATLAIHEHLHSEGYINIHTPILTSNDCEGAGEVFTVYPENEKLQKLMLKPGISLDEAYFDTKVFLTVSGQLHLEAVVHGMSKVYTFGPTFRAENSRSRLHLSEFYMLEVETAFINNIESVIETVENLIKNVTLKVQDKCESDLDKCYDKYKPDLTWVNKKFPVITHDEAVKILNENQGKCAQFSMDEGFTKEHEIFLVQYCGNAPTFVINWPKSIKPFYMRECPIDATKVAAFDLLAPSTGEIVGGSLRENDYNKLKGKLPIGNTNLNWYLELRKYGNVPTGGFGMGFERFLQFLLGVNNIKDCIPFPRWPHNCNL